VISGLSFRAGGGLKLERIQVTFELLNRRGIRVSRFYERSVVKF
jgi:hypothetical protein